MRTVEDYYRWEDRRTRRLRRLHRRRYISFWIAAIVMTSPWLIAIAIVIHDREVWFP